MDKYPKRILKACRNLDKGRPEEALRILGKGPDSVVAESISLTAHGLMAERAGRVTEAARCFEGVFARGVPLPTLLRQCGRYFKRTADYERSFHCYSILDGFEPRAINEFVKGLPPTELFRYSPLIVRRYLASGDRPRLYSLQPVKEALATQLGSEGAALAFARMAWEEPDWDIARMSVTGLQDFAKTHGLVYEELGPSANVHFPSPPVFGGGGSPGFEARTRTFFFCILKDVIVSSKSNFLLAGDRALLDHQNDELTTIPLNLDVDPIVIAPADGEVSIVIDGHVASAPELDQAFPLVGVHSRGFGHLLLEFLPKLFACLDRPGFDSVPILIDEQMPPQHREAFELFAGPEHPLIALKPLEAVRVNRLWACSTVANFPVGPKPGAGLDPLTLDGEVFAGLLARVHPKLEAIAERAGPRRIYLTRRKKLHRKLVNRPEVERWFMDRGFEVFDFQGLSFREQLALVRGADLIVGPDGSANAMSIFARPGTRVGILTNPYAEGNEWYALVSRLLGHHLSILTGEIVKDNPNYRNFSDYRIDLQTLPAFLDGLLTI